MSIRVALGADRHRVLTLILRQSSVPVITGVAAGALGALALGGALTSLLYEVQPRDPLVTGSTAALVALVAIAAALTAARRGLRIEPADALRAE
jgi:ABC-type antimicrobial peptide transport system permease subunit